MADGDNHDDDLDPDANAAGGDGDTGDDSNDGTGDGDAGDGGDDQKPLEGEAKRIADLTSARDKETARANKAEAALKAARGAGDGKNGAANDPAMSALMTELREASLDAVFGEFPELREYGIDRAIIEGTTRTELRTSAAALVGLIKSVSTKARNKALADAGVKVEPTGSTRKPAQDFAAMSDADFEKYLNSL